MPQLSQKHDYCADSWFLLSFNKSMRMKVLEQLPPGQCHLGQLPPGKVPPKTCNCHT